MKTTAEKSTHTTSVSDHQKPAQPFFTKAGGGDFFAPVAQVSLPTVQAKLTVNKPGDRFEQEADKMADKVMRMPACAGKSEKMFISPGGTLLRKEEEKIQKATLPEEKIQKAALPEEKIQKAALPEDKIQKASFPEEKIQKQQEKEDKIQRKGNGVPSVGANVQSSIQNKTSGGQPLSTDVRSYMEPRFNADFSNVKIHNDPESGGLSNHLSARAFTYQNHIFFSHDQYQPGTSDGKQLLAHELTHTIQQGHSIQRSPQVTTTATPPPIQRLGVQDALDYFADKAYYIPGFRMLTILMGFNPINMRSTDRSAANILRALIELVPGGHLITQALDNHGVFNKAGAWVEQQITTLGDIGGDIVSGLKRFIDSLSWTDIFDLGGVWDRAKRIFTGPIGRLISFAGNVVSGILKLVKDAILKPLATLAQGTRGYDLLKAILGEDPITGEAVPRNADTLIGGFMKLIGQEEIWENIKKGNAIGRAWAWFQGALGGLMGLVRSIPRRIADTISSLTFQDIITVVGALGKIIGTFVNIAGDFISWGLNQVISLLEILFSVVAPGVMPYIARARAAFTTILRDPVGFVGNLVRAGKTGFEMFASNILTHLKAALIKWITGPLGDAGVYIPKSFTLMEIIKLVLSVLGLTWQNIRSKLVKIIPEPVLVVLEKSAGILVTLVKDGPAAAWEQIKEELSELKDQMIAKITEMVSTEVVKAAVMKLVSMLNPAGAVIQAIIAIYNTVTFFIQKINQIAAVVASFIDSIAAIASGQIANASKKVEQTMANTLTIIIAFLAKFAGLGNIPEKVVGIIKKIRQPIDKGLDKIVGWLGGMLKKAAGAIKSAVSAFFTPKSFKVGAEEHKLYPDSKGDAMVASGNPKRLEEALKELGGDVNKAKELGQINQKLKATDDPVKKADLQKQADKLTAAVVEILIRLKYGERTKSIMPLASVSFNVTGNAAEFKRQIAMQHNELKTTKVGEWQKNRARFIGFGRDKKADTDVERRAALVARLIANPVSAIQSLASQGLLNAGDQAIVNSILTDKNITDKPKALYSIAKQVMDTYGSRKLAVLHRVDQVAGGSATVYGDDSSILGGTAENSEIGNQWKTRITIVDTAAKEVSPSATMNLELKA